MSKYKIRSAILGGNVRVARIMVNRENLTQSFASEILRCAVEQGRHKMVELLFENGVKPNDMIDGNIRLHTAVAGRFVKVAKLLLANGVDVNKTNQNGLSPLHIAVHISSLTMIKILLANGANIEQADNQGRRPIFYASWAYPSPNRRFANVKIVLPCIRYLIKHGADVNARDNSGRTALHYASKGPQPQIVKQLLASGSDIKISCGDSWTAFQSSRISWTFSSHPHYRDSTRMIGILILKNYVAGLPIIEADLRTLRDDVQRFPHLDIGLVDDQFDNKLTIYEDVLKTEVASMKNLKVHNDVSLHDIFVSTDLNYRSNEALLINLKSIRYGNFPEYRKLLRRKIEKDEERYNSIVDAKDCFYLLMTTKTRHKKLPLPTLPDELIEKIILNLNNVELQNFIFCSASLKKQLRLK